MATTRPFSRNLGSLIAGTSQVGNLAIGTPTSGFEATALKWWMGADEDLGYVIAIEDPSGLHIGADGVQSFIGFKRSAAKTEASFLQLVQSLTGQTFVSGNDAKAYLNANGMWTSWGLQEPGGSSGSGTTGTYTLSTLYSPASNNGQITFPTHPISGGAAGYGETDPNLVGQAAFTGQDGTTQYKTQIYINYNDVTGASMESTLDLLIGNSGTLTLTQGSNSVTYGFTTDSFYKGIYPGSYSADNEYGGSGIESTSLLGSISIITPATSDFDTTSPITISVIAN
jgi:hypothetical protein